MRVPPENRPLPRPITTRIQDLLSSVRWAARMAWSTNAQQLVGVIALAGIRGLIPGGMALTARGLVNATVATLQRSTADLQPVAWWLLAGFVLTAADGLAGLASELFAHRLRDDLNYRITSDILAHASKLDVASFEDPRFQDVLERAKQDPAHHVTSFVTYTLICASSIVQAASLLAILLSIEPLILLILAIFTLPYLRFQWRLTAQRYALDHSRATKRRWNSYFISCLTGRESVAEVKILGLAPLLIDRFRSLMAEFHHQDRELYTRDFAGSSWFTVLTTAAIYAMFVRVAFRVLMRTLTLGDLAIFGGATTRLRNALETVVAAGSNAMEQTLYIANVIEFFNVPPSVATGARPLPAPPRAEIEFRDVFFAYPGCNEWALAGIDLHILPGETVAFVGENGAGKTTLVKVLARLYEPNQGRILIDGIDVQELSREQLYSQIAFVFQGFGRYEATAADNIAYGDWRRTLADRERVKQVATMAGVDAMIAAMPQGYDTMLGRMFGEYDLSGGQWQKIAVARAFARDAALLILDEPTSNIDARAEYELFTRFRSLAHGRTTIIISHRFSTVSMANRIFVMDRGRIVESGTHEELLAHAGSYADLYRLHQRQMTSSAG